MQMSLGMTDAATPRSSRRWAVLALTLCGALVVAACGADSDDDDSPAIAPVSAAVAEAEQSAADEGTAEQSAADEGTAEQSAADEGTAEQSAADQGPAEQSAADQATADQSADARAARLAGVTSWAYQLQGTEAEDGILDLAVVDGQGADLLVVDFSRDGSLEGTFGREELAAAQADGTIVLAYLSIGEAEIYRDYWRDAWIDDGELAAGAPPWLADPNPAFPDNYKVRYWDADWQALIVGEGGILAVIVAAGFDGVYLDIIDGYEFWEERGAGDGPPPGPAMAAFVRTIAETARTQLGAAGFFVFPQNGAPILASLSSAEEQDYLDVVDGIGVEDTFYFGDDGEDNPLDPQEEAITYIQRFRAAGKLVLAVDYLTQADLQADFYARAREAGFVPYVAVRALDHAIEQPLR